MPHGFVSGGATAALDGGRAPAACQESWNPVAMLNPGGRGPGVVVVDGAGHFLAIGGVNYQRPYAVASVVQISLKGRFIAQAFLAAWRESGAWPFLIAPSRSIAALDSACLAAQDTMIARRSWRSP